MARTLQEDALRTRTPQQFRRCHFYATTGMSTTCRCEDNGDVSNHKQEICGISTVSATDITGCVFIDESFLSMQTSRGRRPPWRMSGNSPQHQAATTHRGRRLPWRIRAPLASVRLLELTVFCACEPSTRTNKNGHGSNLVHKLCQANQGTCRIGTRHNNGHEQLV